MSTFVSEILGRYSPEEAEVQIINRIIKAYSELTDTRVEDLAGPSQVAEISQHRHRLMYLIRKLDPAAPYSLIGRYLGGRDMATVHEAVAKVTSRVDRMPGEATDIARIGCLIKKKISDEILVPSPTKPWQLLAATQILRDAAMTDAEARKAALGFLQQLEAGHGH